MYSANVWLNHKVLWRFLLPALRGPALPFTAIPVLMTATLSGAGMCFGYSFRTQQIHYRGR